MISDFLILEDFSISNILTCHCYLPDPDLDNADDIIICGNIEYSEDFDKETSFLKVMLNDNFKSLCIGEVYQRKAFIYAIIENLSLNGINIVTSNLNLSLSDPWGDYTDTFPPNDKEFRRP